MEHINSEVMATKTINNVTITLTREWSIFDDKKDCVFCLRNDSQNLISVMYYEGEALNQFQSEVNELENKVKKPSNLERLLGLGFIPEIAKKLDSEGVTADQVEEEDYNDYMSIFYPEFGY